MGGAGVVAADAYLVAGLTTSALLLGYLVGWKSGRECGFKRGYTMWAVAVRKMGHGPLRCPCCGADIPPRSVD